MEFSESLVLEDELPDFQESNCKVEGANKPSTHPENQFCSPAHFESQHDHLANDDDGHDDPDGNGEATKRNGVLVKLFRSSLEVVLMVSPPDEKGAV